MFTGIIEAKGKVSERSEDGRSLVVASDLLADLSVGSSVAVDGTCLTVVDTTSSGARFDVVEETLSRTTLGGLEIGDQVNLERAMPAAGRFEGHIVQGHVDGTGTVRAFRNSPTVAELEVDAPGHLLAHIVEKGSIAIDGVSLTVASVDAAGFTVALIPHTLALTTMGSLQVGDRVNLETDILAKYVGKMMDRR